MGGRGPYIYIHTHTCIYIYTYIVIQRNGHASNASSLHGAHAGREARKRGLGELRDWGPGGFFDRSVYM